MLKCRIEILGGDEPSELTWYQEQMIVFSLAEQEERNRLLSGYLEVGLLLLLDDD